MKKLTLQIDDYIVKEIVNYLFTINDIINVEINNKENIITITYQGNKLNSYILKKEIMLFLNIQKPTIMSFDKHSEKETKSRIIIINDLCCEYCFMNMIEELLDKTGIEKAFSDFDYNHKKNIKINIYYDANIINEQNIIEIERSFNR